MTIWSTDLAAIASKFDWQNILYAWSSIIQISGQVITEQAKELGLDIEAKKENPIPRLMWLLHWAPYIFEKCESCRFCNGNSK